jgi:ESCRT-II complex subunit VPS36
VDHDHSSRKSLCERFHRHAPSCESFHVFHLHAPSCESFHVFHMHAPSCESFHVFHLHAPSCESFHVFHRQPLLCEAHTQSVVRMNRYLGALKLTESGRPVLYTNEEKGAAEIELQIVNDVSVYLGDTKKYKNGLCTITNHRVLWVANSIPPSLDPNAPPPQPTALYLLLAFIKTVEHKTKIVGFSSPKIIIHLADTPAPEGAVPPPPPGYIKLSFHEGSRDAFLEALNEARKTEAWKIQKEEKKKTAAPGGAASAGGLSALAGAGGGISAIMKSKQREQKEAESTLSVAFQDLDALMGLAKDLVSLADAFAKKKEQESKNASNEEGGTGEGEDITSVMISLGIVSPVTKESAGSTYYTQLARQFYDFINPLIQKEGGVMMIVDAYCLFNRARGTELISPEDLVAACQELERLRLPMARRKLPSGVVVLQLASHSDERMAEQILELISSKGPVTAVELSQHFKISMSLAKQHLLTAEQLKFLCRDETINSLRFYRNIFV